MLEIIKDDIAALNDEDLRGLVGMLCEAEVRSHGLPTSAVTWGGDQNAPDGGIDVRVKIVNNASLNGFLPRTNIGFQVKKTDFTPSSITPEMRPKGELRTAIRGLIDDNGAYIIVSSGSNCSDSALNDRTDAMRAAVYPEARHDNLFLDFYDRNRLATWTRSYPGLILWVRARIGRSISGWQPYSSWTGSPDGLQDEYLLDDQMRLHTGKRDERGIDASLGIDRIRDVLRNPHGVVRLVGLSGVGKTRLVQALFDDRIGANPLNPAWVAYTDMGDNPLPQPTAMISDLVALRSRAILVIDNCGSDLHRRLTEICRKPESLVSVITVEYDVQDDDPEGTDVFRLEPSSVELVSRLIGRRFPEMTQLNSDRIAEFSGGNARIAFAIANTLERDESVAGLKDEELFKRLFQQRQDPDDDLLRAAQACALLYSFQGEALSGDEAELPKIASLVELTPQQLYAKVGKLKRRDLVQSRGVWRAILPHAIANRLAKMAICEIPLEAVEEHFNTERLMRSFSRRLGYLHESNEALLIVKAWLSQGGWLSEVGCLNEFGLAVLKNIAPVSPELTLAAIEIALQGPSANGLIEDERLRTICTILHSIAYDASLFDRCINAMISLAFADPSDAKNRSVEKHLIQLFSMYHSGTHATIQQRITATDTLLRSNDPKLCVFGYQLLDALLSTEYSTWIHTFEFGARVRDYGYSPSTYDGQAKWFVETIHLARHFVSIQTDEAKGIQNKVADSISSIWFLGAAVQDQIEAIANEISAVAYWHEGWIAVRQLLARLPDNPDPTSVVRLRVLEQLLHPKNIAEQVTHVVMTERWELDFLEMGEPYDSEKLTAAEKTFDLTAEELGKVVCVDEAEFTRLLPKLVKANTDGRLDFFGKGLALASVDPRRTWERLAGELSNVEEGEQNVSVLLGFLHGLSTIDGQLSEALLDEALTHETLGVWFPRLQSSVTASATGVRRLKQAAEIGLAKASTFSFLGIPRYLTTASEDDLRSIVLSLAKQDAGYRVAIHILSTCFRLNQDQKKQHAPELVDAGRTLLCVPIADVLDDTYDHDLGTVASACLRGAGGTTAAKSLCEWLKNGFNDYRRPSRHCEYLLEGLFQSQTRIALDVFFGNAPVATGEGRGIDHLDFYLRHRNSPLDSVPAEELFQWCDELPTERYPLISRFVTSHTNRNNEGMNWTPLAIAILQRAPDPMTILEVFVSRFFPRSWSGSRAAVVESQLCLLDCLGEVVNASVAGHAFQLRVQLVEQIARMRIDENERDIALDERFE